MKKTGARAYNKLCGILDGLRIEEIDGVLNQLLEQMIPILGQVKGEDHFCLIHLALLQSENTFICRWHGNHQNLTLSVDGVKFLHDQVPLNRDQGIIWKALDALTQTPRITKIKVDTIDPQEQIFMIYNNDTDTYRIDNIPKSGLKKAVKLYNNKMDLKSVFFAPVLFSDLENSVENLIGIFAVDSEMENAFTTPIYERFLKKTSELFEIIIKTLYLGYYDYALGSEGVYNQAFLWHFWKR